MKRPVLKVYQHKQSPFPPSKLRRIYQNNFLQCTLSIWDVKTLVFHNSKTYRETARNWTSYTALYKMSIKRTEKSVKLIKSRRK